MTEDQRQHALALCGRILETAAKVQADLREAKKVIKEEMGVLPLTAIPEAAQPLSGIHNPGLCLWIPGSPFHGTPE